MTNGDDNSFEPGISADGRYVTYRSDATDLVSGDGNGEADVFVSDRARHATTRITDGNDFSFEPGISADGRYVTYSSYATDLVPGDGDDEPDVFPVGTQHRPHHARQQWHRLQHGHGDLGGRQLRHLLVLRARPGPRRHQRNV